MDTADPATLEEMRQEIDDLAPGDPDTAAYLQSLLDSRREE